MIACISVPEEHEDSLSGGRRIWPFGSEQAGRAYALDTIPCPHPDLALVLVIYRDDDAMMVCWFNDEQTAMLWATTDALTRSLGLPFMPDVIEVGA